MSVPVQPDTVWREVLTFAFQEFWPVLTSNRLLPPSGTGQGTCASYSRTDNSAWLHWNVHVPPMQPRTQASPALLIPIPSACNGMGGRGPSPYTLRWCWRRPDPELAQLSPGTPRCIIFIDMQTNAFEAGRTTTAILVLRKLRLWKGLRDLLKATP